MSYHNGDNDEPKSPTMEELPKLPTELAAEMLSDHELRHVNTDEKVVLPTAEGMSIDTKRC